MYNVWLLKCLNFGYIQYTEKGIWAKELIYDADPNLGNFNFTQEPNDL